MLKITILLLGLFWCLGLWIEGRDAAKSRATLRHVVHVNGTRGKSTVCRLIEAGLRSAVCAVCGSGIAAARRKGGSGQ